MSSADTRLAIVVVVPWRQAEAGHRRLLLVAVRAGPAPAAVDVQVDEPRDDARPIRSTSAGRPGLADRLEPVPEHLLQPGSSTWSGMTTRPPANTDTFVPLASPSSRHLETAKHRHRTALTAPRPRRLTVNGCWTWTGPPWRHSPGVGCSPPSPRPRRWSWPR